ncbi:MAG: PAS domain-containing sensor histidine kinase, partial [bacterium]
MKEAYTKGSLAHQNALLEKRISQLEKANQSLNQTIENYSALFEHHNAVMYLLDPYSLKILDANKAAEKFYGYKKEKLLNMTLIDLSLENDQEILKEIENANKEKRDYFQLKHNLANGEKRDVEIRSTPIFLNNASERFFAIVTDITKQKEIESILKQAKEHLEESDKLKSEFLTNMSHEIRTPLNGILGFSDMLREDSLSREEKNQYLDIIDNCSNHLLNLVNNLIDLSQIESGQLPIKKKECNIIGLFNDLYLNFKSEITKRNKDIQLLYHYDESEKLTSVYSDPIRLKQILHYLIDNAIKFTDSGYIKYTCTFKNDYLEFSVHDTGIGMETKDWQRIFKRFIQADTSSSRRYQGNGLGLTIAKGLIELLEGKIWLDSKENEGSSFYFSIPYKIFDKNDQDGRIDTNLQVIPSWSGKTIIIVEDDSKYFKYI